MAARLSAFIVWAAIAASLAFWGLRLLARPLPVPAQSVPVSTAQATRGDMARLFASPQPAAMAAAVPALASRFQLLGVMAPKTAHGEPDASQGVALIAIDGKPPRAFRVGARLDGDLVLLGLSQRKAAIGPAQGAPAVVLEVPPLPPPATGTLPSLAAGAGFNNGGSNQPPFVPAIGNSVAPSSNPWGVAPALTPMPQAASAPLSVGTELTPDGMQLPAGNRRPSAER